MLITKEQIEGKLVMKVAENADLEVVNDFRYLGAYIVNCHVDFKRLRGLAWSQLWKLATLWKSKEILLSLKLHLFGSLIPSIIFYHAENWTTTTKVMKKEIKFFGTSCYRYMRGIKRIDKIRNKVLKKVRRNNLSNFL